jgi:hypothetical protein
MRVTFCSLGIVAFLAGVTSVAQAAPITLIHTARSAFGTIDGVEFEAKDITITATGDTDARIDGVLSSWFEHLSASIEIEDVGTFTFSTPTRTFVNGSLVGFSRGGAGGSDLVYSGFDPAIAAWDLLTSIGPVDGPGTLQQWDDADVLTSGGVLFLYPYDSRGGTFEAIVIPAPASIAAFASVGLLGARRRR